MNSCNIDEYKSYTSYDEVETEIEEAFRTSNSMSQNGVEENHSTNAINETMKYFRTIAFMQKENKCDDDCRCCLRYDQLKYYTIEFMKGFMNHDIKRFEEICSTMTQKESPDEYQTLNES